MPKAKSNLKTKSSKQTPKTSIAKEEVFSEISNPTETTSKKPNLLNRKTFLILILAGLILLAVYKKNWFVAAMVNGQPITNFEVLSRMNQQHRQQTIDQMVNEKIIMDEARKKGITITKADIDNKISQLEQNVGGAEVLDSLLSQQGQTRDSIRNQLSIQLTIEKLYSGEATTSAEEIDKFITDNAASLNATESAAQKIEAQETIKQQKLSQIFEEKFQALKQAANIKIF